MAAQGQAWQKDAADQNFDYMFKLLVIGNSSVGKTSFLFRYADDSFTSAFVSTVGIDFKVKTVFRQDKRVKLQIWVSDLQINNIFINTTLGGLGIIFKGLLIILIYFVYEFYVLMSYLSFQTLSSYMFHKL